MAFPQNSTPKKKSVPRARRATERELDDTVGRVFGAVNALSDEQMLGRARAAYQTMAASDRAMLDMVNAFLRGIVNGAQWFTAIVDSMKTGKMPAFTAPRPRDLADAARAFVKAEDDERAQRKAARAAKASKTTKAA